MKSVALALFGISLFWVAQGPASAPRERPTEGHPFPKIQSRAALEAWAKSMGGGYIMAPPISYRGRNIAVVKRQYTLGRDTFETTVFVEQAGAWRCLLYAASVEGEMEFERQGDSLIIRRREWPDRTKKDFIRFDLTDITPAKGFVAAPASKPTR